MLNIFWGRNTKGPKHDNQEEFEDTKEVIRRRIDNTMAKRKRTNNDLQNIHIKLKIE